MAGMRYRAWLLSLLALPALLGGCKKENAYVAPPPPQVGVAAPAQQKVTPYLELTGNTVAYNQVSLEARVEGFLQEIRYKDGSIAKLGDTLFVIEPAPYQAKLQQAQAAVASVQAQLVNANIELSRQATLLKQNVTAQSTYDSALAKRDSLNADLANDQAGVTLAAINLGYTHVTAPFDGVATNHLQSVGALVGVTGPTQLNSIVQIDPIYAEFNVSEQDVLRVKQALAARGLTAAEVGRVPVEIGLMTETGYPHAGTIDYISPSIDPATGTLLVRGVFQNPDHALLPGFFARVRVPLAVQSQQALLVPDTALGADQAGRYVLVVGKDNVVEQRVVTTGQLHGDLRVIASGLKPDDQVVISGVQRAVPGQKVAPVAAKLAAR